MRKAIHCLLICLNLLIFQFHLSSAEAKKVKAQPEASKCLTTEGFTETTHELVINGKSIAYKAVAGTLLLKNEKCDPKASIFFISYMKEKVTDLSQRPITFCFNGGPGSSSVWLHLGTFGPKRVALTDNGDALPPYHLIDNEFSILDDTDLVFIDPVSTGFSRAIPPESAKDYHGVEEDIKSMAEFIRIYITQYHRWESPKFIAGESYGTTRAVGLAGYLHKNYYLNINGLILVSSVLNFQSIDFNAGNDLPYLLFLPSYTATAWYHKKLPPDLQQLPLEEVLKIAREFVDNVYANALFKGDLLSKDQYQKVAREIAHLTGLSVDYVEKSQLRIDMMRYVKELLRNNRRTIGRFDSRFLGIDIDAVGEYFEYDPSMDAIFGAFTATLNHYIYNDLKWKGESHYKILTDVQPWKYGNGNQYLNVAETLRSIMTRNPYLRIFVANGCYDLATPFFATEYTFNHLGLDPSFPNRVMMTYYDAGHMMYIYRPALIKLKEDLAKFFRITLEAQEKELHTNDSISH